MVRLAKELGQPPNDRQDLGFRGNKMRSLDTIACILHPASCPCGECHKQLVMYAAHSVYHVPGLRVLTDSHESDHSCSRDLVIEIGK